MQDYEEKDGGYYFPELGIHVSATVVEEDEQGVQHTRQITAEEAYEIALRDHREGE